MQKKDYNTNKLTTHFIPLFTVGEEVDYKAYVLAGRPALPEELVIGADDTKKEIKAKDKEIQKLEELKAHYAANRYLVDLTTVKESELSQMVYTTVNVIDSGRISGTVLADNDRISACVAVIVKNLIKGNEMLADVAPEAKEGEAAVVEIEGSIVSVRYTSYAG